MRISYSKRQSIVSSTHGQAHIDDYEVVHHDVNRQSSFLHDCTLMTMMVFYEFQHSYAKTNSITAVDDLDHGGHDTTVIGVSTSLILAQTTIQNHEVATVFLEIPKKRGLHCPSSKRSCRLSCSL